MLVKLYLLVIHFYSNLRFLLNPNISIDGRVQIKKTPIVDIRAGARLNIGSNVTLNSNNQSYHVSLFAPVKLFARIPGASIEIGDNTRIHGSCIHSQSSISIGRNCLIAGNCQIIDGSGHELAPGTRLDVSLRAQPIVIEDNVWFGNNVTVLGGVTIGEGSIIQASCLVHKDVPPYAIMGGNPGKIIKHRNVDHYKKLKAEKKFH